MKLICNKRIKEVNCIIRIKKKKTNLLFQKNKKLLNSCNHKIINQYSKLSNCKTKFKNCRMSWKWLGQVILKIIQCLLIDYFFYFLAF